MIVIREISAHPSVAAGDRRPFPDAISLRPQPRGFAHGFVVLSADAVFFYKCDNYYNKPAETGIMYNDPDLQIDWRLKEQDLVLSEKDQKNPQLKDILHLL